MKSMKDSTLDSQPLKRFFMKLMKSSKVIPFLYSAPEIMQEILARMNFYSNLEQIELLEVLKDQNFKPPKILPVPDLSDTPRSSFFLLVHNAYECVLEFIRKKETKMQVLPFPPKVRCFTDDELEKILDFSKQKVLEASSFQVGVLHERVGIPAGIEDQYLQQIRHERLEAMLSQEVEFD